MRNPEPNSEQQRPQAEPSRETPIAVPETPGDAGEKPSQVELLGEQLRADTRRRKLTGGILQWDIRFPRLYILYILLNLLDLMITRLAINNMGMVEANFLARGVLLNFGFAGFLLYKLLLTAIVIVLAEIIARKRPRCALAIIVFGCVAVGAVVAWGAAHLLGFTSSVLRGAWT